MSTPVNQIRSKGKFVVGWPDPSPETREDSVRKDLTSRLKGVCDNLSSVDFEALLVKMTDEQLRGERVPGRWTRPN